MATGTVETKQNGNTAFAGVAMGAVTTMAVAMLLTLFGGGLGMIPWDEFATLRFENFFPGTALKTVALAFGSFLAGGYAAARWTESPRAGIVGVGTWALTTTVALIAFGPWVMTTLSTATAGTKPAVKAIVETLESIKPRIISDMSILKGKIVTKVDLKPPKKGALDQVQEETHKPEAKRDAAKAAYTAERFQLLGFTVLMFALAAAVLGAWLASASVSRPSWRWFQSTARAN